MNKKYASCIIILGALAASGPAAAEVVTRDEFYKITKESTKLTRFRTALVKELQEQKNSEGVYEFLTKVSDGQFDCANSTILVLKEGKILASSKRGPFRKMGTDISRLQAPDTGQHYIQEVQTAASLSELTGHFQTVTFAKAAGDNLPIVAHVKSVKTPVGILWVVVRTILK